MYSSMQQGRLLWSLARPCRFVAQRRYPAVVTSPLRRFHLSQTWRSSIPPDPNDARDSVTDSSSSDFSALNGNQNTADSAESAVDAPAEQTSSKESRPYGSAIRRALRSRKRMREAVSPTAVVPDWFRERNTVLNESRTPGEAQQQVAIRAAVQDEQMPTNEMASGGSGEEPPAANGQPFSGNRYALTDAMWDELRASARAGLRLPPTKYATDPSTRKSHLVLHYPGTDGILFLDAVVKRLSQELNTDLVTLNAQDIAQLCLEQDLADTGKTSPIRLLGYEVFRPQLSNMWQESSDVAGEEDDGDADSMMPRPMRSGAMASPKFITIESSREPGDIPLPGFLGLKSLVAAINPSDNSASGTSQSSPNHSEARRLQLLHKLLSSPSEASHQSAAQSTVAEESPSDSIDLQLETKSDIIVQIQDYGDIQATREGARFLSLLQKVVQDRRGDGHRVLFIGTAAQEVPPQSDSSRLLQNAFDDQFSQMVVVTPAMKTEAREKTFAEDRKKRTLDINIRHIQSMLRTRLGEGTSAVQDEVFQTTTWPLESSLLEESGLDERYWSYNQIHWAVTLALGNLHADEALGFQHIQRGIEMLQKTDHVRDEWLQERNPKTKSNDTENNRERLLASLRKTCNTHEKKLLNGVVDAKSIRTTFNDVHVPSETIDALKTLTSLSLIRPEAFTYGVLATDKIPGLLLYGPPGTGKTLLAKAVARESGATVLEVSGSEVYDMYVGEGEKNVKAIFTLAKKLNPCVVFIDEADAIFCSRTGASSRTSHRELINQFLREWDGMNDLSTFIMVATNRPFDLDDAVLRRLPRRLLVDLPTEQDRQSILKIHLKEETVESSVDLAELARLTPLYSGSDLKNLCVAAALACVREENALAQQHTGDEPYQYPERRTLTRAHFTRGMEEISASISEDMSSLSAIRKFDEQYGDRKGRRKKTSGWGFNTVVSDEAASDAARVRT
ncbi:ATP-binding protein [Aspergillus stella-maris]|uniref:ATP-binding protein n=1 Tax=Aspergillus stella-maris TaxID=1810926 RepID=UPI003CCD847D